MGSRNLGVRESGMLCFRVFLRAWKSIKKRATLWCQPPRKLALKEIQTLGRPGPAGRALRPCPRC